MPDKDCPNCHTKGSLQFKFYWPLKNTQGVPKQLNFDIEVFDCKECQFVAMFKK